MSAEVVSIVVLAAMFVIATWRDVNMGWLGYLAAFVVGGLALGLPAEEYLAGFPIDLFLTLVGLTFLFGFAQDNGVIEVIVHWCVRLVRGRVGVMPWVFFGLTAVLIALGALFAVAIVTPDFLHTDMAIACAQARSNASRRAPVTFAAGASQGAPSSAASVATAAASIDHAAARCQKRAAPADCAGGTPDVIPSDRPRPARPSARR